MKQYIALYDSQSHLLGAGLVVSEHEFFRQARKDAKDSAIKIRNTDPAYQTYFLNMVSGQYKANEYNFTIPIHNYSTHKHTLHPECYHHQITGNLMQILTELGDNGFLRAAYALQKRAAEIK
jgi:hypothetical protein